MTPPVNIDGSTVDAITIDGDSVSEVTVDGSTVFSAIPDSVVSRDPDNSSAVRQYKTGVRIETSQDWPEIQAEVSANSDNATKAYLQETDGTVIDTVSTNLTAGDVVTFDNANLSANTKYDIVADAEGSDYAFGTAQPDDGLPHTSSDGNLSIIAGWNDGSVNNEDTRFFITVGNINL